jgi:hypothetical protein
MASRATMRPDVWIASGKEKPPETLGFLAVMSRRADRQRREIIPTRLFKWHITT